MTENAKTITFVVVGLVAVGLGLYSRPTSAELDEQSLIGVNLTDEFDSTDEAKRLRIVRFDEDTATLREFEVAEQDGLWSIPSKSGYPADAAQQMAQAATSLMDRKILQVASSNAGDHEEFGVIDPLSPKLEVGQKGVGTHVTMSDVQDQPLADLIVGKAVKGAEGQRYVREVGRDLVYVIEIDPTKLSTNFEDWIEKDLLKLNSWDLQQVQIKDYSTQMQVVMTQEGPQLGLTMDPRSEMSLAYNETEAKWSAEKLQRFDRTTKTHADFTLAEDEELNAETLNGLKTALDDLQIVDVVRKPQGLSNDLKAGADFLNNEEALQDLVSKGFIPAQAPASGGAEEIISSDGEVIATMKNGTEYVLRFGNLKVADGKGTGEAQGADAASAEKKVDDDGGIHRYLFVMARFNENSVKRPELQELPELPPQADAAAGDQSTEGSDAADNKVTDPAADTPAEGAAAKTDAADAPEADAAANTGADVQESATETSHGSKTDAAAKKTDEATTDTGEEAKPDNDKEAEVKNVIAERTRIEQENKRKLDDYQQSLEKGRESVKELNVRFGDWYFVVADDVFKKIRPSRESVIKKKEKKEEAAAGTENKDSAAPATTPGTIPGLPSIPGASE
jgi:hypothetical protein